MRQHVTRTDAERLVKLSRDNTPVGRSPGRPKRRWKQAEQRLQRKVRRRRRRRISVVLAFI